MFYITASGLVFLILGIVDKIVLCCQIRNRHSSYKGPCQKMLGPTLAFLLCSFLLITMIVLIALVSRALQSRTTSGVTSCDDTLVYFALFVLITFLVELVIVVAYMMVIKPRRKRKPRKDNNGRY